MKKKKEGHGEGHERDREREGNKKRRKKLEKKQKSRELDTYFVYMSSMKNHFRAEMSPVIMIMTFKRKANASS